MIIVNEIRHIKNITFLMDFYVVKINNFIKVIQHLLFLEKQRDKYVYYITRTNKNKNKNKNKKVKNVNTTTNSNEKNNEKNDKNNENNDKNNEKNDKNNDNVTDDHCGHHECDDLEGRHKIQQILYNIKNMKKKRIKKNVLLDFYTQILTIHRRDQPNLINYYVTLINKLKTFKYNIQLKKIFIQNVIKEINKEYNSFLIDLHYMYFKVKKEVSNINNYDNNNEGHEIPSIAFNTSHNKHIYVYKSIGHVYKNILKTLKLRLEVFLNYIYNLCNNIYKKINIYMANVFSMFIDTQEGLFSLMSKRKEYLKEIIKIISAQDNSEHVKNRISCDTLLNTFNNNDIEEDGFEKYNLKNNQNMNNDEYTNHYMSQKKYTFTKLNYITSFYENNYYGHENNNVRRDSNYFQNEQENINESGHINNVEDNINGKKKEQEDQNKDNNNENNNNDNENNNNDNENNNNDNNNDNNDNNVVKPRMKKEVITIKNEVSILQILSFPYDEFFNELIEENYNEENIFKKSSLEMYKIYSKYCYSTNRKEVKECVGVHLNRTCLYQENNFIHKVLQFLQAKKCSHIYIHNKQNTPSVQDTHNNDSKSIMSPDFNNDTNKKRETHINNNIPNPNDGRNEDKTTILDEKRKLEESQNEEKNKCPILEIDDHIFEINDKDHLNYIMRSSMNTFNCALSKKILIQGKIFITMDGIYFISLFNSLFSKNTILKIKYVDIVSVEKLTILHFLANSIKIITKYKSFVFTSFVHRNHCYNLIMDMIYENNNTHIIPKKGTVIIDRYHEYDTDEKNDLSDEVDNTNDINYHIKEGIHTNDKIYKGDIINDYKNNHIIDHYLKDNEMLTDSSKIKNDFPTNIENNKTKNNITNGKCPILHVSNYTKDNNIIYVETINKHLPLNIDTEENEILKNNNFINCTNYIDSLFINRNFKDIFLDIYSNLQNQYNPLLKSVLDKKPLNLSYEHIKDIKDLMYNKTFLTYTTEYNILLFNNETKLIGLPDRSNVKEIFMFFFFKNNIIIQKIITLLSNIPLAGSFNTIVTLNIHNVMNQNTNNYYTQIDFSYDIEFVKSTFFKNHIKNNALPRLEKSIKDLKDYTKEAILQIYQNYDNQTINNNHVNPHQQNNMNQKNKSQKYQSFTFKNNIHIAKTDLQHMTINELREYFKHDFKSVDHLSSYTPRNHVLFNSIHYGICNLQIT
ncbi:hypothetical protein PFNF135_02084 [Plasmodium falciparum NF135/5.C10]|uniref:GRAM domain-containing protein n=1 Tax=Plasmodium falciparum NF135/5.C10 TaxID=1036726 RepID=W4IJB6_PLAFA|nr:hypothetical protein PFNF135_02084 [Plasmodium falciparum NF135/5.C10]